MCCTIMQIHQMFDNEIVFLFLAPLLRPFDSTKNRYPLAFHYFQGILTFPTNNIQYGMRSVFVEETLKEHGAFYILL